MPRKTDIKIGDVINGLEVINSLGSMAVGKETKRFFLFKCSCGDIFECSLNRVSSGNTKSCGCKRKYPTPRHKDEKVKSVLSGTKFIRADNEDITNGTYKVNITCTECFNSFPRDFYSLIKKPLHCFYCTHNRPRIEAEDSMIESLNTALSSTTLKFYSKVELTTKLKTMSDVYLQCYECKNIIKRQFAAARDRKNLCPCKVKSGFKQNIPAVLYLLTVKDGDAILGYKYGITNNFKERLSYLRRHCIYEIGTLMVWEYVKGIYALKHEKTFKDCMTSIFTKEQLRSGRTETFSVSRVEEFLNTQTVQYIEYLEEFESWI